MFGNPIDQGKGTQDLGNLGSSNTLDLDAEVYINYYRGVNFIGLFWTLPTNCPPSWDHQHQGAYASTNGTDFFEWANYQYPYLYPAGLSVPNPSVWSWMVPSGYARVSYTNYWEPMWLTIHAKIFDTNNAEVYDYWYPTNAIGQTEVAPTNWVKSFGGSGTDGGSSVAVDTNGNTYIAGYFSGTATVGSTELTATGSQNMLLAKYNANGVVQWAKRYGLGTETPAGIALDSGGNIWVVGTASSGSTDLTGAATNSGPYYLTNGVVWLAKYNSSGVLQWGTNYAGTSSAGGIAIDSADYVYITGIVGSTHSFCSTWWVNGYDTFLCKVSPVGACVWAKNGQATDSTSGGVAVDSSGNVYIGGTFRGNANWGLGLTSSVYTISYSAFLVKYNSSGTCLKQSVYGELYGLTGGQVAVDRDGSVYLSGSFPGTCDFGSGAISSYLNYMRNPFLAKYSSAGAPLWAKAFPGNSTCMSLALATDSNTNVWITGYYPFWLDMPDGGSRLTSLGGQSIFVAKFNAGGTNTYSASFGGPLYTYAGAPGLAVDSNGFATLTGYFYQTATFGSTVLNSQGGYDGFLVRQHP